eukprot:6192795-Pleurochrysis_carterae.AAC.4
MWLNFAALLSTALARFRFFGHLRSLVISPYARCRFLCATHISLITSPPLSLADSVEGILADSLRNAASNPSGEPALCAFVWYDLPNRDCHAKASGGEICCRRLPDGSCDFMAQANGCAEGLKEYMHEYVDPFVEVLARYSGTVPVVLVMEPDSLPNLVTNQADPRCGAATKEAYTQGLSYAIQRIADAAPHVSMYLDAGANTRAYKVSH